MNMPFAPLPGVAISSPSPFVGEGCAGLGDVQRRPSRSWVRGNSRVTGIPIQLCSLASGDSPLPIPPHEREGVIAVMSAAPSPLVGEGFAGLGGVQRRPSRSWVRGNTAT